MPRAQRANAQSAGAARSWLALSLAVCIAAFLVFGWTTRGGSPAESLSPGEPAPAASSDAGELESASVAADERTPEATSSGAARAARDAASLRFDGRGTIRGEVAAPPGIAFPREWTLVIEPHPYIEGRERAALRRVEFHAGEREFEVGDLPLAGYQVRAQARGLNNLPCSVLLVRGSADQYVTTELLPAGFVEGTVRGYTGTPAEGLDVTLERAATHERRTVSTDAAGGFLFSDVVDGGYTLTFGDLHAPLLAVETIAFKAPSLRFPTRTLPPTCDLKMRTLTVDGVPRPDTHVSAFATPRGAFDVLSDPNAAVTARHLWPGRYRIAAESPQGEKADLALDIEAGQELTLEIRLQR